MTPWVECTHQTGHEADLDSVTLLVRVRRRNAATMRPTPATIEKMPIVQITASAPLRGNATRAKPKIIEIRPAEGYGPFTFHFLTETNRGSDLKDSY